MYVCGVMVYDECHIGHAQRARLRRGSALSRHSGFSVTFVKNFTDADKIIKRANELGTPDNHGDIHRCPLS
jgi:cysteinyl-tRNA synthetase